MDKLSRKFPESREHIAAMTMKAREMLAQEGIHVGMEAIMDGIDSAVHRRISGMTYAEAVASYVTFRRQGESHWDAVQNLEAILNAFGVN